MFRVKERTYGRGYEYDGFAPGASCSARWCGVHVFHLPYLIGRPRIAAAREDSGTRQPWRGPTRRGQLYTRRRISVTSFRWDRMALANRRRPRRNTPVNIPAPEIGVGVSRRFTVHRERIRIARFVKNARNIQRNRADTRPIGEWILLLNVASQTFSFESHLSPSRCSTLSKSPSHTDSNWSSILEPEFLFPQEFRVFHCHPTVNLKLSLANDVSLHILAFFFARILFNDDTIFFFFFFIRLKTAARRPATFDLFVTSSNSRVFLSLVW